jgi:hypothetical protein
MLVVIGGEKRPHGSRHKWYQACFFLTSAALADGKWCLPMPIETCTDRNHTDPKGFALD